MEKIWIVSQESNVDGEISFNVTPCASEETAKEVFKEPKDTILNKSGHFAKENNTEEDMLEYEIEDTDTYFFIYDTCDDYYEVINVFEKEIQY